MRRVLPVLIVVFALAAGRAEAVTIRDLVELSRAGLGDEVLIALIEVDRGVFPIDAKTLKQLKDGGVSEAVIVALIRSGRTPPTEPIAAPVADPAPLAEPREPQVVVIDHHDQVAPAPVAYPVPVYVPVPTGSHRGRSGETVTTVVNTDQGLVKARVPVPPNCTKAEPVYWGFGGKLRPGSWAPPTTVVCR
jgi:hypothetical protein